LRKTYGFKPSGEEILSYVYSIFFSNKYRMKYDDFLRTNFPRVPFTTSKKLFTQTAAIGKKLMDLHLLRKGYLNVTVKFQGEGPQTITIMVLNAKKKRLYINETQYFEGIDETVWEYRIGAYQVLRKWLKYRKGQEISLLEIKHLCRVASSIKETLLLQKQIDALYPEIEKDLVEYRKTSPDSDLGHYS
jgi:predicted helicase